MRQRELNDHLPLNSFSRNSWWELSNGVSISDSRLELFFGDSKVESICKAACLIVSVVFFSFLAADLAALGVIISFRVVRGWKL